VCGKVGIAGSVTIGDRVRLGGGAGVGDHLRIGDAAVVGAASMAASNVAAGNFVSGVPAISHQRSIEQYLYLSRLKRTHQKVENLIERLDTLEQKDKK
jgi:UDP-3-O-[3-hydroxymyristoyl] glucosamine N-acyltransferase